jgi:hypothetical protein
LFELLSRAQSQRLDDQRGLSFDRFELPDFLKTDQPTNKLRKGNIKAPLGHNLHQIRSITPGPGDISFMDDSFSQDCVLPSHADAENMFSGDGHVTSTPDFDNPLLMKKSVRDLGFNYSIMEDNQHCLVKSKSQNSVASNNLGITPIRPRTPLDKKLSPRATLPVSAFNEPSPDNTCFDDSDSLNLTVIGGNSVADASLIGQGLPPAPELLETSTISHVAEANFPPPPPLKPTRKSGNLSGSSQDSTFTGSNGSQKSPMYALYSLPENHNDPRRSPYSRRYPNVDKARSYSADNSGLVPSQSRRSTPTISMNETTMTFSPSYSEMNSTAPAPSSKQMPAKRVPPPVPQKPKPAVRKNMGLNLNSPPVVKIEITSPSPDLPSPSTHRFVLPPQSNGEAVDFNRQMLDKDKMRRVSFENPEVREDAKVTFV